jgi:hypothetical protein
MKGSAMGQVHEVHTSELKSFRGCRRRWSWIFRENYYPKVTAKPLEFGSAYHAGMEAFYEPMRWEYPHEVKVALAITTFVDLCNEQKAKYVSEEGYLEDEVEEDFNERVELGKGMLQYYGDQVKRTDHRFKPVKVEIPFEVPIINPDTEDTAAYEAGLYDEMLEWLKVEGPQFFKRYQIHKSEYQNSQTGLNIYKQAHDIVDKDLVLYPNPGRFACGFCAFRQPCLGVNDGSDYKYTLDTLYDQRPFHYWVKEAAPTTEKSGRLVS